MNIRVVKFVSDSLLSPLAAKTYSFTKAIHSLTKRKDSFLLRLGVVMVMVFCLKSLHAATVVVSNNTNWSALLLS